LLERFGHRRALLALTALLPVFYALASTAGSPLMLFVLLVPAGLCIGAVEIIVNLEADRVEHQTGRRFMNRAHAFWSAGFFAAGLLGALMSQLGITPQAHLAMVVPIQALGIALVLGRFDAAPHRDSTHATPAARLARPTWGVLMLVAVSLSALVLEGAEADWSAIYMRDVFGATPFLGGIAVATGALAQAITRFFADRFVERHQPVAVARTLLGVLGAGTALVFAAPTGWVALLGFALMGVGTSAIFPLAMSAAAQRTDRAPATNVAALAQISFVAFLLGPPLLGLVAQAFGIRWSFGIGLPLVALSLVAVTALRVR
jgi:MFS family permease